MYLVVLFANPLRMRSGLVAQHHVVGVQCTQCAKCGVRLTLRHSDSASSRRGSAASSRSALRWSLVDSGHGFQDTSGRPWAQYAGRWTERWLLRHPSRGETGVLNISQQPSGHLSATVLSPYPSAVLSQCCLTPLTPLIPAHFQQLGRSMTDRPKKMSK